MFMGEFELPKPWDPRAIEGCNRFLRRVFRLVAGFNAAGEPAGDPHCRLRHRTVKRVHGDLDRMQFNTSIARLMEYANALSAGGATAEDLETLVKLVAPFAPHLGDELWEAMGKKGFVLEQQWPSWDDALTAFEQVTIVVQINGRLRGEFTVAPGASEGDLRKAAFEVPNVKPYVQGKTVRKVIVVPEKLVNIVVG
jgi:leucyl-tRNA synthetase